MSTVKLPYMTTPGTIDTAFAKIQKAKTPAKFTLDFVNKTLQMKGGTASSVPAFLKKIGFLESDGTPTQVYKSFRNKNTAAKARAKALQAGYKPLYDSDEECHKLNRENLKNLVVEVTGLEADSRAATFIVMCFEKIKDGADFSDKKEEADAAGETNDDNPDERDDGGDGRGRGDVEKIGLSYQFNLVLPNTDDPAVFNAIFKALRDNLLR